MFEFALEGDVGDFGPSSLEGVLVGVVFSSFIFSSFDLSSFFDREKTPFRSPKPNFDFDSFAADFAFGFSSSDSEVNKI